MTTVDTQDRLTPSRIGQATAVEQSRAIAQVQAMVVVAQQCPRNVSRSIADMRDSCRRKELADHAFYRYPKGGGIVSGPSIKLARELARVWGNIEYGVSELRRDDDYGQSEMLAFAWDLQTNARNSSIVINPHQLYTGGRGQRLTELRDVYDNNANVGARRVREAIFAVLPTWFVEEAIDLCSKTLADGGGIALATRIANAIEVFGNLGVTVAQLEAKLGTTSDKWTDADTAQLRIIRQSLLRGEVRKEEEFPPERVTAAEITGQQRPNPDVFHTDAEAAALLAREGLRPDPTPVSAAGSVTGSETTPPDAPAATARPGRTDAGKPKGQPAPPSSVKKMDDLIASLELGTEADVSDLLNWLCPGYTATRTEVATVTTFLVDHLRQAEGDTAEACSAIWGQFRARLTGAGEPAGGE